MQILPTSTCCIHIKSCMESFYVDIGTYRIIAQFSNMCCKLTSKQSGDVYELSHATVNINEHFSVPMTQLGMLSSHFNEHFLLVTLFVKLFVSIIDPLARETIFRIHTDHIKASTTAWSCILDVTFFMILAAVVNTPFARQAFLRVSNQWKATMFTFWPLTFHVAFWMVCLTQIKKMLFRNMKIKRK